MGLGFAHRVYDGNVISFGFRARISKIESRGERKLVKIFRLNTQNLRAFGFLYLFFKVFVLLNSGEKLNTLELFFILEKSSVPKF